MQCSRNTLVHYFFGRNIVVSNLNWPHALVFISWFHRSVSGCIFISAKNVDHSVKDVLAEMF